VEGRLIYAALSEVISLHGTGDNDYSTGESTAIACQPQINWEESDRVDIYIPRAGHSGPQMPTS
jgi:hypothetical protein